MKKTRDKYIDSLPEVEINFPGRPGPDFFIKINGVKLNGTTGVMIKSPLISGHEYPTVEVSFFAKKVKGKIKGLVTQKP